MTDHHSNADYELASAALQAADGDFTDRQREFLGSVPSVAQFWVNVAQMLNDHAWAKANALYRAAGVSARVHRAWSAAVDHAVAANEALSRAGDVAEYGSEQAAHETRARAEARYAAVRQVYDHLFDPAHYARIEGDGRKEDGYCDSVWDLAENLVDLGYTAADLAEFAAEAQAARNADVIAANLAVGADQPGFLAGQLDSALVEVGDSPRAVCWAAHDAQGSSREASLALAGDPAGAHAEPIVLSGRTAPDILAARAAGEASTGNDPGHLAAPGRYADRTADPTQTAMDASQQRDEPRVTITGPASEVSAQHTPGLLSAVRRASAMFFPSKGAPGTTPRPASSHPRGSGIGPSPQQGPAPSENPRSGRMR